MAKDKAPKEDKAKTEAAAKRFEQTSKAAAEKMRDEREKRNG